MDSKAITQEVELYASIRNINLDMKHIDLLIKVYITELYEELETLKRYKEPLSDYTEMFRLQELSYQTRIDALKYCCNHAVYIFRLAAATKARYYYYNNDLTLPVLETALNSL
jgi:hypothetical protein